MAKKKSAQVTQQQITVWVGYGLFVLTFLTLALSVIPAISMYADPVFKDYNYTLLLVSFIFTAIAAPLVGYLAGGAATRSSSNVSRRFNGVMFGVLGVWLWSAASMYTTIIRQQIVIDSSFQEALISMAPAAVAAILTIVLGMFYARETKQQKPVIKYAPYRWTLFGSVVALIAAFGIGSLFSLSYGSNFGMTILINMIVPLLLILTMALVGYWLIGTKAGVVSDRVVYALVAISYALVTAFAFGQVSNYFAHMQSQLVWTGFLVGLGVWIVYLYLLRRSAY